MRTAAHGHLFGAIYLAAVDGYRSRVDANAGRKSAAITRRVLSEVTPFAPSPREQRQRRTTAIRSITSARRSCRSAGRGRRGEADSERAIDIAQLSLKLREPEDRVAQMEGDIRHYQDRAIRAGRWMNRIQAEIEDRSFKDRQQRRRPNGSGQR